MNAPRKLVRNPDRDLTRELPRELTRVLTRDIAWLAALGVCIWFFPRTLLAMEAVGAVGTIALFWVEKRLS